MAPTQLIVYNQTVKDVNITSQYSNMKTPPPSSFTVKAGQPYKQDVLGSGKNSSFTLTFDGSHTVTTEEQDADSNFSITPATFKDGVVGVLAAPSSTASIATQGVDIDILHYFIGTGRELLYLNAALSGFVGPAVVDFNRKGPHEVKVSGLTLEITKLDLLTKDLIISYASRIFVPGNSQKFTLQAVLNLSKVDVVANMGPGGTPYTYSLTGVAMFVVMAVDLSAMSFKLEALQASIASGLNVSGDFDLLSGDYIARLINVDYNTVLIEKLNDLISSKAGSTVNANATVSSTTTQPSTGPSVDWATPLVEIVTKVADVPA